MSGEKGEKRRKKTGTDVLKALRKDVPNVVDPVTESKT